MSQRNEFRDITKGVVLLLAAHVVAIVAATLLCAVLASIGSVFPGAVTNFANTAVMVLLFSFLGIGITQWLYVAPLLIRLRRRERWALFKGVLIGALLTMLLNGGCFLLMFVHP